MPFQPVKKATLLMPSGPAADPNRLHLFVILTDPCPRGANLLVSVSSVREGRFHDPACIVEAGEHRRIKVRSWVEYRLTRAVLCAALIKGEAAWLYRPDEPITDELHRRMCGGLMASDHCPPRLRRYFEGKGLPF